MKSLTLTNIVIYILCIFIFLSALFTSLESPLRYIKYVIFVVMGFFLIFYPIQKIKFDKSLLQNLLIYGIIFTVNLLVSLFNGLLSFRFFEEVILIILPVLTTLMITGYKYMDYDKLLNRLFFAYVFAFCAFFYKELINIPKLISSFGNALRLSEFPTESWMAFPFGLFFIYYLDKKDRIKTVFALIFFLLCFKRISFLAVIIGYGCYFIFYKLFKLNFNKKLIIRYLVVLNLFLIGNMYLFINGFYSYLIKQYTGISVNHFTQGRFRIYNDAINYFSEKIVFGSSLGITNIYLSEKFKDIAFLHSDLLKLILEIGIILFIFWLISFMVINLNTKKSIPIIIYINILFISDNVFIYFDTLLVLYIILKAYQTHEDHLPVIKREPI